MKVKSNPVLPEQVKRILIIEGWNDMRSLIRIAISKWMPSAEIYEADSAFTAAIKIANTHFDAVIGDGESANGAGLWLHYFMREFYPNTPLFLFTAEPDLFYSVKDEPFRYVIPKTSLRTLVSAVKEI